MFSEFTGKGDKVKTGHSFVFLRSSTNKDGQKESILWTKAMTNLSKIMRNKDILMTAKARTAKISNGLSKITYVYV